MNILMIGIGFLDYERKIQDKMLEMGYSVDLIFDIPSGYRFYSNRIFPKFINKYKVKKHKRFLYDQIDYAVYDLILVVTGRNMSSDLLDHIRKRKKNDAKLILYLWDDIARVANFWQNREFYDKIYSFDPLDCAKEGFEFLPLFYSDDYCQEQHEKKIDLYCAMNNHSDRVRIMNEVAWQNRSEKVLHLMVNIGRYQYIREKIRGNKPQNGVIYNTKEISRYQNIRYMCLSRAMLDIQYEGQTGLTVRTMETIGSRMKIITTNEDIINYDFYYPENIQIINRKKPVVNWSFFDIAYKELPDEIYEKYSLKNWINVITGTKTGESYFNDNRK